MFVLSRGAAFGMLSAIAGLILLHVALRDLHEAPGSTQGLKLASSVIAKPRGIKEAWSRRERILGRRLPVQLPNAVQAFIDPVQFPGDCDQDTPATVWSAWSWGGPGLGAHFIHWSWTLSASVAMRRTYVVRDPDLVFGYNEGGCEHSLLCAVHPISSCTESEVDGRSHAAQQARAQGWVYGFYGSRKPVNMSTVADVRRDPGRIFNSEEYWADSHYGDPTVSCRATMWVPAAFRSVGSDREWHQLRDTCNFSAFDGIPDGLARASQDLLWWRSMMVGYFFQPLPAVLELAQAKAQRAGLETQRDGAACVSLHVRRGDKVAEGSAASEGQPHKLDEYMALANELAGAGVGVLYLASDDLSAVLREWNAGGHSSRWRLLVDREELPWSIGFDIGRRKRPRELEETVAAVWTFSSCAHTVGSLESYFYKLAVHVGIARGIHRQMRNLGGAQYILGQMAVPGKRWNNFMP